MTIGTILNHRYRIVELIGSGGMAHVYRAVHMANHKISVAVKVLRREYCENAEFLRRFERESRAVLRLSHKNIVRAYGVGQYNGAPYIILEYVEGKTLKQIVQENGSLPPKMAAGIICQILDALDAAHEAGIIHRDVKPQNIIITNEGVAKLTDFGIAREAEVGTVTFAGDKVIGSAHYISPEQAMGEALTFAADLYSVGVVLFELLTGTVPFNGETSVAIALKHISEEPGNPIALNADIPPAYAAIILRALQKKPELRFSSARTMCEALKSAFTDPAGDTTSILQNAEAIKEKTVFNEKKTFSWREGWRVLLIVILCACVLLGTFFGTRNNIQVNSSIPAPSLLGKAITEAEGRVGAYGIELQVKEYIIDPLIPYGHILSQTPEAGTPLKGVTEIEVVVSLGPSIGTVPNLIGLTFAEAVDMLNANFLSVGEITYQVSDELIGYVSDQYPSAFTECSSEQKIDICINATSAMLVDMPKVLENTLDQAVEVLASYGFKKIFIVYDQSAFDPTDVVIEQSPMNGTFTPRTNPVQLVIGSNVADLEYGCDISFNLSIPENRCEVVVTVVEVISGIPVERIIYEKVHEENGSISISVHASSETEGLHEVILYLNGKEDRRQESYFGSEGDS